MLMLWVWMAGTGAGQRHDGCCVLVGLRRLLSADRN